MFVRLRSPRSSKISFFAFQDIITSVTGILILVTLILTLYLNPPEIDTAELTRLARTLAELTTQADARQALNVESQRRWVLITSTPDAKLAQETADLETAVQRAAAVLHAAREAADRARRREETEADRLGLTELRERVRRWSDEADRLFKTNAVLESAIEQATRATEAARDRLTAAQANAHKLWLIPDPDPSGKIAALVIVSGEHVSLESADDPTRRRQIAAGAGALGLEDWLQRHDPAQDYLVFYVRPSGIRWFETLRKTARDAGFDVGHDAIEEDREIQFGKPPP